MERAPEEPEDDVPAWVMTFSDVITLLMTFFILLLTFATNNPETLDRVQVSLFGHGGSPGFVTQNEGMVKDSIMMRMRARSGRVSKDGSEIPPAYSDPDLESMDKGLAGLEKSEERVITSTHHIRQTLSSMVDADGNVTGLGAQQLKMLAKQMRKRPLQLDLVGHNEEAVERAIGLIDHMMKKERIPPANMGTAVAPGQVSQDELLIVVQHQGKFYGQKE